MKIKLKKGKREKPKRLNLEELNGPKAELYSLEVNNRFEALGEEQRERTPEELWKEVKTILLELARTTLGNKKKQLQNSWISDETFEMIKAKREPNTKDREEYKELKKEVQRKPREDKQKQIEGICEKLEESNKKGNMKQVFQTIKTFTKTFRPQLFCIKSKEGEKITDKGMIAERLREYCGELYADNEEGGKEKTYIREAAQLRSEVARAMKEMANGKSAGPDEVPAELFKYAGETTLDKMHRICTALWETREWSEDWMNSIFVLIPKKGDLGQCKNNPTIALVAHASKIMLKIVLERIREKTESEINDEQAGFRKGRGTHDQITNLRILKQKLNKHQQPLYMCFVDFTKAFDNILHKQLWVTMTEMGYPVHIIILLTRLPLTPPKRRGV